MLRSEFSAGLYRIKIKSVEVVTRFMAYLSELWQLRNQSTQKPLAVVLADRLKNYTYKSWYPKLSLITLARCFAALRTSHSHLASEYILSRSAAWRRDPPQNDWSKING